MATSTTFILISIFVLVYICTVHSLGQSEFRDARFVLAFPVSVLCVLGVLRGGDVQEKPILELVLIPYAALAYALIFMVIMLILFLFRSRIQKVLKRHDRPKLGNEEIGKKQRTVTNQEKRLKENLDETCPRIEEVSPKAKGSRS
jgi:hypothetical protein